MPVHSSRFENEAIDAPHLAEQFKISSPWALLAGSLVWCIAGVLYLAFDLGLFLAWMRDVWSADVTLPQKYGVTFFTTIFWALHSVGGIALLWNAIGLWRNPYRLILDGNGQLIVLRLMGRKRIAVDNIQTVEIELGPNRGETVSAGIRLKHSDSKMNLRHSDGKVILNGIVILPLFNDHEKFVNKLTTVCPAIDIINRRLSAPPIPGVETLKIPKCGANK